MKGKSKPVEKMDFRNEKGYEFYTMVVAKTTILDTKGEGGTVATDDRFFTARFDDKKIMDKIKGLLK